MIAIAAMSQNRVIARDGRIPWHLPEDFRWFRRMTEGNIVLMGRKTFESMGRPLPRRHNLVVTRHPGDLTNAEVITDLDAFDPAKYDREVFVIGGAQIYAQLLRRCSDLYLTVVQREVEGDTFFPEFEDDFAFVSVVLSRPEFEVRHYRNRRMLLAG